MPELPEVETIICALQKKVLRRAFLDVWTDFEKIIKKPTDFKRFRKTLKNKKIQKIWRRGKNIIFDLSGNLSLLIHQKMTGHFLVGYWVLDNRHWKPRTKGPLEEKVNSYIHLMFFLDNKEMLAFSDLRKFAKVELWNSDELRKSKELTKLGPEPLEKDFTFKKFKETLKDKKGKIKQVLMNQEVIAGIGNIYSDEILWKAQIYPLKDVSQLKESELKRVYQSLQNILKKAIKLHGESISDFRDIEGRRGRFDKARKVYKREGEKCGRCETIIKRIKIGGRSCHYCPICQKL